MNDHARVKQDTKSVLSWQDLKKAVESKRSEEMARKQERKRRFNKVMNQIAETKVGGWGMSIGLYVAASIIVPLVIGIILVLIKIFVFGFP